MPLDSLLNEALNYAKLGFPVFPLSPLSKIPIKGSKGFKEAITDEAQIVEWFTEIEPLANIGISLVDTPYFILDCDRHTDEKDGIQSLLELSKGKGNLENAVTVKTVNDGLHFIFKAPKGVEVKQQIGFKAGLDVIKNFVVAPPSQVKRKDGTTGMYELVSGSFENIKEAPAWLLSEITSKQQPEHSNGSYTLDFSNINRPKTYFTAKFMAELKQGAAKGFRNSWVTRQFGRMVSLGMSYEDSFDWIKIVNQNFIDPPLEERELNGIVYSIIKRENRKLASSERSD